MKLTMTCPKCGSEFDEGLVREISDVDSVDLIEFMDGAYRCANCGYTEEIGSIIPHNKNGRTIY